MNSENQSNLWSQHQKQWDAIGSPLRPATADLVLFNVGIKGWVDSHPASPANVFVLGVTPEFPMLNWPEGSRVFGLDSSINMIRHVWPVQARFASGAVAMDWLAVPLVNQSADIIIGDGCFSLLSWPDGYRKLLATIAGLLKPDGRLLMRFFIRPQENESTEQVFADLAAGQIHSFHAFKWRLAMAMHGNQPEGVAVRDIWQEWNNSGVTEEGLVQAFGWRPSSVHTIEAYKMSPQRLSFPTLKQVRDLLGDFHDELSCDFPDYELGNRCPILVLAKKSHTT